MIEILFLLLPVAAASGWWLARRELRGKRDGGVPSHPDFLRGLNYLLEEQPDKAIDTFLKLAEVDGETVETHLALGSLFRRRGEVDRAIRIHQNLIARKNLGPDLRGFALYELGQDYMRAGLLDRAEGLFQELVEVGLHRLSALKALREIYQQERDWLRCLEVAGRLQSLTEQSMVAEMAHYHCELAEDARRKGDLDGARLSLIRAQEVDPTCIRAAMIEGMMTLEEGDPDQAVVIFLRVAERGAAYVSEILPALIEAAQRARGYDPRGLLEDLAARHPTSALLLGLSDLVVREVGEGEALERLTLYLSRFADLSVLERLVDLELRMAPSGSGEAGRIAVVLEVVRQVLSRQPVYQCEQCGFQARSLHWQCPSCKCWGRVLPVQPEPILQDSERADAMSA
ncbi:lipopolysaccharide assembly protein LapB [Imhoffiella purpurea]|uniref:Lipopolysaccharide assembly protein B n=1 Tax=Imhoffiella purpurea TaxID=1249627 RepID=W9VIS1_9GAMM|nr:lipopolysaccharide assembly protein LapB [Imhoffiella purpurea]EXJ15952.1 Heat shock protein YciM [Imhoffiella purpurea]